MQIGVYTQLWALWAWSRYTWGITSVITVNLPANASNRSQHVQHVITLHALDRN